MTDKVYVIFMKHWDQENSWEPLIMDSDQDKAYEFLNAFKMTDPNNNYIIEQWTLGQVRSGKAIW